MCPPSEIAEALRISSIYPNPRTLLDEAMACSGFLASKEDACIALYTWCRKPTKKNYDTIYSSVHFMGICAGYSPHKMKPSNGFFCELDELDLYLKKLKAKDPIVQALVKKYLRNEAKLGYLLKRLKVKTPSQVIAKFTATPCGL